MDYAESLESQLEPDYMYIVIRHIVCILAMNWKDRIGRAFDDWNQNSVITSF